MTREEAQLVLCAYRPGDDSPVVQRALAEADRDPELHAWLADQLAFDRQMTGAMKNIPVPAHLKHAILREHQVTNVQGLRKPALAWAIAALLILGGTVFTLLYQRSSNSIEDFRTAMIQELWTIDEQAKFRATNIGQLRRWLDANGAAADFTLPAALKALHVRDARIVEWSDQKVASFCLIGNGRHLHVFVVPTAALASSSLGAAPEFELCHGLDTLAWTHGANTYLLSGANCVSLIKNPRRAGHWFFTG